MLKIGVLGTGHLGKIHLKCIQLAADSYELVGFHDPDPATAAKVAAEFGITAFPSVESLMDAVEVIDIVTPTIAHFELARQALLKKKHIFIEKPLTHTLEEAEALVKLQAGSGVKVQVGHVERFNPALLALDNMPLNPMFIEAHRLAMFNPRGTDVSVVLDLMIHDLDILLSMVPSEVKHISASGVPVVSDTPDIANARIEFENGCVANLTASRISIKQMRKVRLFQQDAYISLDFLDKQAQIIRLFDQFAPDLPHTDLMELDTPRGKKLLQMQAPNIEPVNAIKLELESLASSIRQDREPPVSIQDGYKALRLAYAIIEEIERRSLRVAD
jgi:predicted dehydrogenase